jgi:hypothetical protein
MAGWTVLKFTVKWLKQTCVWRALFVGGGGICFRHGMAHSFLDICHYWFQELILSSTQRRSCKTAISKRRLLCLSVRYLGTMCARILWYPSPTWAKSCTVPTDNCNATGNSRIPTRRFNKIRSFSGSPFTSVLHELGRLARSSLRMPFRSFPHSG